MMLNTVLITGANRGIGLEFTRQYLEAGWRVFACCRDPKRAETLQAIHHKQLHIYALDVADVKAIDALAKTLENEHIDILLNNAGVLGPGKMGFGEIVGDAWVHVFQVNTMAALLMTQAFVDQVMHSRLKIIANISSIMGSVAENTEGGYYLYRASKVALNAMTKNLSIDLKDKGVIVVALHPGWVKTEMGGPDADMTSVESVLAVRTVLDNLTREQTGKFFAYDGRELPW